ncbi:lipopolysaccharide biosynthesis protein [Massilia sp. G4R7]|uniref:Lipopolysaccharide biosynthesis protein n=1 Tax=Massilia phyllostachyos TaxID=2898585 RepID=A0ABS8QC94_9BURK|nr:lipopolysaccharide biosynthesis protein [Massilia phyllostachyos]MCD2519390.1 lipopolysaccharide biosynthesis protein [Massilia phyllostachyos]
MPADTAIKRNLGIAFVTQYTDLFIQFVGVMILARIITSEEIGIYSVAAFLMALLHVFRDFGVTKYLIQEPELTPEKIRSALGAAILLAWAVALVLFSLRHPVARFYDEPRLADIMAVMSISFAVTPFGSVVNAIYRRDMAMRKVATVQIGSGLFATIVSTILALNGFGAMTLAWSNLAGISMYGVIAALLRGPGIPLLPRFRDLRDILRFGSIASLGSLANVAGNNSHDVIIGKMLSLEATGYFSRGNGFVQIFKNLISGAVGPLVLPYFSALRHQSSDMVQPYRAAIIYITGVAWPFFGALAVLALPIVRTFYGPNWDTSVPLVQILCAAGALSMLTMFAGDVMIANGHVKAVTKLQLLTQPVRVAAILAASTFGLAQVAAATVLAEAAAFALLSPLLHRTTGITVRHVLGATLRSTLVTGFTVAGPLLVMLFDSGSGYPLVDAILGGLGALAGWLAGVFWCRHPIRDHLLQARLWLSARILSRS